MTKIDPQLKRYYDLRYRIDNYDRWCDQVLARTNRKSVHTMIRRSLRIRAHVYAQPVKKFSNAELDELVEKKKEGCKHCGSKEDTELEHETAIKHGGKVLTLENLQWLCRSCHRKKTRKENVEAFRKELEELEHTLKNRGLLKGHTEQAVYNYDINWAFKRWGQ